MKKSVLVLFALATAVVSAQVLTPGQTLDRRAIGERGAGLEFSPDGSRVVFTVAEPVTGAARARAVWIYDLASGQSRPLTFSGQNDSSPQWSPDGRRIALLMPEAKPDAQAQRERDKDDSRVADRDTRHARVWMLDVASRSLRQLTTINW